MKKRIYIDMDKVLCDYSKAFSDIRNSNLEWPQSKIGFFENLEPIEDAIDSVNLLRKSFEVYILTRPSTKNINSYSEKAQWIKNHFGEEMLDYLILCPDKSLVIGDYLIDDSTLNNQELFNGKFIQFGKEPYQNWNKVISYILAKEFNETIK